MESVLDRLLRYIKYDTRSMENQNQVPSTYGQLVLGKQLVLEMQKLNMTDAVLDHFGFVMGTLPSNATEELPTIAFFAHLDTSPEYPSENVRPQIIRNYSGSDIILNLEKQVILSPKKFPELLSYIGQDIVTTDGTTLLGADAKGGIAEILTAIEYLNDHPEIIHGPIKIIFTPDEELTTSGIFNLNYADFSADYTYILDSQGIGEINYENFNAAVAKVNLTGKMIHPGQGKNKMINAIHVMNDFLNMLPSNERPEHTSEYEGYYFVESITGEVEEASISIDIRDFDSVGFQARKDYLHNISNALNIKYKANVVNTFINDIYLNMGELIGYDHKSIQYAIKAMVRAGIKPIIMPLRGGHDGTALYDMGIFAPNLFVGVHNAHGKYEFIPIQSMEKAVETIVNIIEIISSDH